LEKSIALLKSFFFREKKIFAQKKKSLFIMSGIEIIFVTIAVFAIGFFGLAFMRGIGAARRNQRN
jgi:hypothetical protein